MPKVKKIYISARDSKILTVPVKTKNRTPDPDSRLSPVKTHDSYYKMHEWITTDLRSYNMSRVTMYINLKRCLLTKLVT